MTTHSNTNTSDKSTFKDLGISLAGRADVTVVIATYNRANFLPEAISSLLNQTFPPKRLIVVDDGSTDDTAEIVRQFSNHIEYIRKENAGKAKALNLVLPSIDTEYVWFFDDDDAAYPNALVDLLAAIAEDSQLAFVFGDYDIAETEGILLDANRIPHTYPHAEKSDAWQRLYLYRECTLMMSGSLLRTDSVRAVGGLNETLLRGQDYDLMVRLASRFSFRFCRQTVYAWREHRGPRGTAHEKHAHDDRIRAWARYNEPIGQYLRDQLPINAFCPSEIFQNTPDTARKTQIIRAWALATKLPAEYAALDLKSAFKKSPSNPLDSEEIEILTNIFHHDFVAFHGPLPISEIIKIATSAPGYHGAKLISKGIYWLGNSQSSIPKKWNFIASSFIILFGSTLTRAFYKTAKLIINHTPT